MRQAKMMSLGEIADRVGVPVSLVRYTVNHELVDPARYCAGDKPRVGRGRGHRRAFSIFSAFSIALAAAMLGAGLKRRLVRRALDSLHDWAGSGLQKKGKAVEAFLIFARAESLTLEVGDGRYARAVVDLSDGDQPRLLPSRAMTWRDVTTGQPLMGGYQPTVTVRVRLGRIAGALRDDDTAVA